MQTSAENVGPTYDDSKLLSAQSRTWEAVHAVARQIQPGMIEKDAHGLLKSVLKDLGAEKNWHPPQIRFGANTVKSFGKPGIKDVPLKENDIFFLDIGPVFHGYEGDAGTTFTVGDDHDLRRLAGDARAVFEDVKREWSRTGHTGRELYKFAAEAASKRGWELRLEGASGHRVSDFPHAIHHRGPLRSFDTSPSPNRWILEIQIYHPEKEIAAFHEDLL